MWLACPPLPPARPSSTTHQRAPQVCKPSLMPVSSSLPCTLLPQPLSGACTYPVRLSPIIALEDSWQLIMSVSRWIPLIEMKMQLILSGCP